MEATLRKLPGFLKSDLGYQNYKKMVEKAAQLSLDFVSLPEDKVTEQATAAHDYLIGVSNAGNESPLEYLTDVWCKGRDKASAAAKSVHKTGGKRRKVSPPPYSFKDVKATMEKTPFLHLLLLLQMVVLFHDSMTGEVEERLSRAEACDVDFFSEVRTDVWEERRQVMEAFNYNFAESIVMDFQSAVKGGEDVVKVVKDFVESGLFCEDHFEPLP